MTSAFHTRMESTGIPMMFRFNGTSFTASRESSTVTLTGILSKQEVRSRDDSNIAISSTVMVLQVQASTYNFGSGVVTPLSVDEFVIDERRWEAYQPDGKDQCWEYTDGSNTLLKIYILEVSA